MGKFIVAIIKERLTTLVVFVILGVIAMMISGVARLVLGWLDYDRSSKSEISNQIGAGIAFSLFVVFGIYGHVLAARQRKKEMEAKRKQPPPLPSWVKPLPPVYPEAERELPPRYPEG